MKIYPLLRALLAPKGSLKKFQGEKKMIQVLSVEDNPMVAKAITHIVTNASNKIYQIKSILLQLRISSYYLHFSLFCGTCSYHTIQFIIFFF
jgi:hypothetical protein